jgi:hypothetical protein
MKRRCNGNGHLRIETSPSFFIDLRESNSSFAVGAYCAKNKWQFDELKQVAIRLCHSFGVGREPRNSFATNRFRSLIGWRRGSLPSS